MEKLTNHDFVTGVTRDQALEHGIDFETLRDHEFNPWAYIDLVSYLNGNGPARDGMTGIESIVFDKIQNNDTSWVPTQTSIVLSHFDQRDRKSQIKGR